MKETMDIKQNIATMNHIERVSFPCPKCDKAAEADVGMVLTSDPPQYSYYCPYCGSHGLFYALMLIIINLIKKFGTLSMMLLRLLIRIEHIVVFVVKRLHLSTKLTVLMYVKIAKRQ